MKRGFVGVTCTLLLWMASGSARADLRVGWDCFLPDAPVECRELASAYFPALPGAERGDGAEADLTVTLRSLEVASGRRYLAEFRGKPVAERTTDEVRFTLAEEVPNAAGKDRTLMLLVALLQRGTVPYLHVPTPGTSEGGTLRLEAIADGAGESSTPENEARSGWYVRPGLGGEMVSAGVRVLSLSGQLELNWSDPQWRWLTTASGGYRHLDLELPDGRLRGGFFQGRTRSVLAHSLGGGFGVAIVGGARSEPQNNLRSRTEAGLGLEWVHRDFLRADEGNIGARYQLLGTWDRYETETVLHQTERLYPRQTLRLFARWHLDALDVEADVAGGVVANQPELWDVGGEIAATLRLAAGLELELSAAVLYRGGAVHEPADPGGIDPVAAVVSGSDFGELTYTSGISLAYSLGNRLLRSQDQRWR